MNRALAHLGTETVMTMNPNAKLVGGVARVNGSAVGSAPAGSLSTAPYKPPKSAEPEHEVIVIAGGYFQESVCAGTTKAGKPCMRIPSGGSEFCMWHGPEDAE